MTTNIFQFDLNFHGDYIRGELESDKGDYIIIKNPQFHIGNGANKYTASLTDNRFNISKRQVACYYRVNID